METITNNWEVIAGALASVTAFFTGRKMQKITEKEANANADEKRITNIDKIFKIQNEQIDEIREQFENRVKHLKDYIKEIEIVNDDLQKIVKSKQTIIESQNILLDNQNKMIEEQKNIISKQNRFLGIYIKKYGKLKDDEVH
jgi:septal ring factor EnvC (AmiA/AmiB activator)